MEKLFVDTAGWMAVADASDSSHQKCVAARDNWLEINGILITSDYVIDETLTLIRLRVGIDAAEKWWWQISESPRLKIEWITDDHAERARTWFFSWRDKLFSFTDCTSFVLMRERHIKKALTLDDHFALAGFELLP